MDESECHLLLAVFCVLAALCGSTCSVDFEIGKHTEGTLRSEHAMVSFFFFAHTHRRSEDEDRGAVISSSVEHSSLSLSVLWPG